MKQLLILDNYDSFTYNLFHILEQIEGVAVTVVRNDAIALEALEAYDAFILSPGPGLPMDAGIMMKLIERFHRNKPILGICLGMQAIGEFFGADLVNMEQVCHGMQEEVDILVEDAVFFNGISSPVQVGKYHSWAFKSGTLPSCLNELASDGRYVMALAHQDYPLSGMQYHPESVMTPEGKTMLENWVRGMGE